MGFRQRDLLDQQQVNRVSLETFKESVKPKMVQVVPPNFINRLEAAFEAVANPNPRKRKNSWDSHEGDGDDGECDGTKDASGSRLHRTEKEIEDFMVTLGGRDRTVAGFHLDSEATDHDIHAHVRKSLVERWNNRKKWIGNLQQQANVEDALRFNSFGADKEEFEKYQSSQSHLQYLQKSLGPLNNEDDKFVFIVEGKDSPVLLAGGVVFGSLPPHNIQLMKTKVSVFILHRVNNSKKTSMVLPSGTIKVGKELKKHMVVELPVQSLLSAWQIQQAAVQASIPNDGK
ncbi:hypothetical protein VOLCADRAFT_108478 [Volvox carteri f. nagariensis]|uniref:Uncharacterized protein n=1 Tax=Volvox carteri f. nagariensis TaxID=3068 RepID=D8UKC9_VOLCA|nr:uncharacterized protein VOLCADRAFT_108478 [Volvox carteri f. nagariensis]EFJ39817.1 hypothetical protein VOLCADRAFT_108478 [Volvox carteri f. nagariensis]|eukprot:XP_002959118.1 hypothetical protein VOLCADRAFT_108478 [Volvox carteri f. nagariensis]